jgi:DNA-binding GntR family transcriptional regulator
MNNDLPVPYEEEEARAPLGRTAKSLAEQLGERILEDIMSGRHAPGDRLKEIALAQEHAVSRATVREALISLGQSGYVEQIPRVGARVAAFAREDVFHLFEVRGGLMAVAARKCALDPAVPRDRLAEIVQQIEQMAMASDADAGEFSRLVVAVQALLMAASGNPRLQALHDHLSEITAWRLIRGRASSFQTAERRRECAADWRCVADAILTGNADAAEDCVRIAFEHASAAVRTEFQSAGN